MPAVYRVMTVDNNKPVVANTARGLGVRFGNEPSCDISVDANECVAPHTGGMSVAPSWRDLPEIRIPRRLREKGALFARGKDSDACWRMGEGPFVASPVSEGLVLRPDQPHHGMIEPDMAKSLNDYLHDLAATRDNWMIDES